MVSHQVRQTSLCSDRRYLDSRGWKLWIYEVEGLYYRRSKYKGADQLRGYRGFAYADFWFSYAMAELLLMDLLSRHSSSEQCGSGLVRITCSVWLWTRQDNMFITCSCNIYPLIPHFYIAKLGYTGVCLFFLFLLQNIDCGYSLGPPWRGGSNMYP